MSGGPAGVGGPTIERPPVDALELAALSPSTSPSPSPSPGEGTRRSWRRMRLVTGKKEHAFAAMVSAAVLSFGGDGVMLGAAPLAAATLTSDPRLIAGLTVAATLPWALLCLVSGAVVDRVDRIALMWRIDVLRAGVIGAVALAFALGRPSIYLLFVCFFCMGTAETFFTIAAQAALPSVVTTERLRSANGKLQGAELVLTNLVGPPLGAVAFAFAATLPFAIDSTSFLLSAALLASVRRPRRPAPVVAVARDSLRTQIAVGVGWLWRHPGLRLLAVLTGLINLLTEATLSVLVIHSREVLGTGAVGFGNLLAIAGLGGIVASFVGPRLTARLSDRRTLLLVLAAQCATQLVIWRCTTFAVVAAALALAAFGIVVWNIVTVSLRQTLVPDHLLGRVNSVYRFVAWGTIPIGAALGGVTAAAVGTPTLFLLSGLLLGAVSLLAACRLGVGAMRGTTDRART